jgi:crotonobetainyl-CoA:carnitine CoA-transferase CaiB-like acyl-CoA transferase
LAQAQVQALGLRVPVPGQGYDLHGLPLLFDGQRLPLGGPVPNLGQHNDEIYRSLGFSAQDLSGLRERKVI